MKLFLSKTKDELEQIFNTTFNSGDNWRAHVNETNFRAASQYPIITNERPTKLQVFRWGFPIYLDDNQTILKQITEVGIEWLFDKPMFKGISTKRCLVPLEIEQRDKLYYGAGVWDVFTGKEGKETKCFCLLTTQSKNGKRAPFLLQNGTHRFWLQKEPCSLEELRAFLK